MIGLVEVGDKLRITDKCSIDYGQIGVVDRVELEGVRLVMPDGRKIRRTWGVERLDRDVPRSGNRRATLQL